MQNFELFVRAISLFAPLILLADLCVLVKLNRSILGAILLSFLWNLPLIYMLNICAVELGYFKYSATTGTLSGIPVEFLLGWALLWGPICLIAFRKFSYITVALIALLFDLASMPLLSPILVLNENWILFDLLGIAVCLLPAQFLARATLKNHYRCLRILMQVLIYSLIVVLLTPVIILETAGFSPEMFFKEIWSSNILCHVILAWIAVIGLSATQEVAELGSGTPFPLDPPKILIRTGLYRYVANPMQICTLTLLMWLGIMGGSWLVVLSSVVVLSLFIGPLASLGQKTLNFRFGKQYSDYSKGVKYWVPRAIANSEPSATLYYSEQCSLCRELVPLLNMLKPIGIKILAAEKHAKQQHTRLTYEIPNLQLRAEGVVAFARALEHTNIALCIFASFMRLPIVAQLLQLIFDAIVGGPKLLKCRDK